MKCSNHNSRLFCQYWNGPLFYLVANPHVLSSPWSLLPVGLSTKLLTCWISYLQYFRFIYLHHFNCCPECHFQIRFSLFIFFSCSLCSLGIHWEFICVLLDLPEQTRKHSFALFVLNLISSPSFLLEASSLGLGTLKGLDCLVFSKFLCFVVEACVRFCHSVKCFCLFIFKPLLFFQWKWYSIQNRLSGYRAWVSCVFCKVVVLISSLFVFPTGLFFGTPGLIPSNHLRVQYCQPK